MQDPAPRRLTTAQPVGGLATEDAERSAIVIEALLPHLAQDPRILKEYGAWAERLLKPFAALPPSPDAWQLFEMFMKTSWPQRHADLLRLERFVDLELKLPLPNYAWLVPTLWTLFFVSALDLDGSFDLQLTSTIDASRAPLETDSAYAKRRRRLDRPPGRRRPKGGGDHLVRDVRWFYLVRVRQPPAKVLDLAADYARTAKRMTDARSVVQAGIRRIERLLETVRLC